MIEQLVFAAMGSWRARHRKLLSVLWLQAMATLISALGLIFLTVAVTLGLAERLGAPVAAAVTAGLLLLLAILLLLLSLLLHRRPQKSASEAETAELAETLLRLGDLFSSKVERPMPSLAVAAVLAGLVAGLSPTARRFLLNLADQLFKDVKGSPK